MALTTTSINETRNEDSTPEYYTAIDAEGKGYLAKREVKKEVKVEEPTEDVTIEVEELELEVIEPVKSKNKRFGGKK